MKAVADLYCPLSGEIVEVNETVVDSPELVNNDPLDEGWLFKIRLAEPGEMETLMSAAAYGKLLGG